MIDMQSLGAIVRNERKALGLRQAELAAASGVGVRFLVELEAGKPTAQIGKVLEVLAALGCSIEIRLADGYLAQEPGN
jgi:y4mF family transcriptional regulator